VRDRLLAPEPLPIVWRVLGWTGILLLATGPVVAFWAGRLERRPARGVIEVAGFTAMGLSSLLIVFALAGDALHLRAWLGAGGFTLAVVGGALAVLVAALWRARGPAVGRGVGVAVRGLPCDLGGPRLRPLSCL